MSRRNNPDSALATSLEANHHLTSRPLHDAKDKIDIERAKRQLAEAGHVALANAYEPEWAARAVEQLDDIFPIRKRHLVGVAEEVISRGGIEHDSSDKGLGSIGAKLREVAFKEFSFAIGFFLPDEVVEQVSFVRPGHISERHSIGNQQGPLVAATALRGEVELVFGDEFYPLKPGTAAFFDGKRINFRQAAVDSSGAWPISHLLTQQPRSKVF